MATKLKILLLVSLCACALWSAVGAARSMEPMQQALPQEVYARFKAQEEQAEYYVGEHEGHVAVYSSRRARRPISVTGIELESLRRADRALMLKGIPICHREQLLEVLEDLSS